MNDRIFVADLEWIKPCDHRRSPGPMVTCRRRGTVYLKDAQGNRIRVHLGACQAYDMMKPGTQWIMIR